VDVALIDPFAPRPVDAALLERQREKYRALLELRGRSDDDPASAMKALAARYPGALREADDLSLEALRGRLAALDGACPPRWAEPLDAYHRCMRLAFSVKRAGGRTRDAAAAREAAPDVPEALLSGLLRPPERSVSRHVLVRLAAARGEDPDTLEDRLFPAPPARLAQRHRRRARQKG
jgi:hypothetical protein